MKKRKRKSKDGKENAKKQKTGVKEKRNRIQAAEQFRFFSKGKIFHEEKGRRNLGRSTRNNTVNYSDVKRRKSSKQRTKKRKVNITPENLSKGKEFDCSDNTSLSDSFQSCETEKDEMEIDQPEEIVVEKSPRNNKLKNTLPHNSESDYQSKLNSLREEIDTEKGIGDEMNENDEEEEKGKTCFINSSNIIGLCLRDKEYFYGETVELKESQSYFNICFKYCKICKIYKNDENEPFVSVQCYVDGQQLVNVFQRNKDEDETVIQNKFEYKENELFLNINMIDLPCKFIKSHFSICEKDVIRGYFCKRKICLQSKELKYLWYQDESDDYENCRFFEYIIMDGLRFGLYDDVEIVYIKDNNKFKIPEVETRVGRINEMVESDSSGASFVFYFMEKKRIKKHQFTFVNNHPDNEKDHLVWINFKKLISIKPIVYDIVSDNVDMKKGEYLVPHGSTYMILKKMKEDKELA